MLLAFAKLIVNETSLVIGCKANSFLPLWDLLHDSCVIAHTVAKSVLLTFSHKSDYPNGASLRPEDKN